METAMVLAIVLLMLFGGGCILTAWTFGAAFGGANPWGEFWGFAPAWFPLGLGPIIIAADLLRRAMRIGREGKADLSYLLFVLSLLLFLLGAGTTLSLGSDFYGQRLWLIWGLAPLLAALLLFGTGVRLNRDKR